MTIMQGRWTLDKKLIYLHKYEVFEIFIAHRVYVHITARTTIASVYFAQFCLIKSIYDTLSASVVKSFPKRYQNSDDQQDEQNIF